MASTYSTNLKIELIGTGDQSGTWGTTTNVNLGTAIEEAITGIATANFPADADLTLTLSNTNTTQVPRHLVLDVTSGVSLTTTRNLIVPTVEKQYLVWNNTTGSQSIIVKTSAGTGITVPNGAKVHVVADGTNVVRAFDNADINSGSIDGTPIGASSASTGNFSTLSIAGSAVTATAAELNVLDGITATTAELNILDGVTATASELNILDGVTATTAEINVLDGITATTTELNYTDGVTSNIQTQLDAKAPLANPTFTGTVSATTVDTTNIEVTNLKAKDGTAAGSIADATGVVTLSSSVLTTTDINGGTIDGTTIGGSTPAAGSFTTVSATGNITVGGTVDGRDVASDGTKLDTVETNADVTDTTNVTAAGALMDSELTDIAAVKALDQGVATTDSPSFAGITLTTADINGGTIDGATIATSDITVGSGKTLDVSGGTLTLANDQISGDAIDGGTIGSTTITTLNSTTVEVGFLEVTNIKAKDGTSAGSIADSTGVVTLASSVLTTTDINGGTIDGASLGASTAITSLAVEGNIELNGNLDANENVALGSGALLSGVVVLSGSDNTAVGHNALTDNSSGASNTAVGHSALDSNQTGGQNTAVGKSALTANISGVENTAMGFQALATNTASENTAVGYRAMRANTTGTDNTAIGHEALEDNLTGLRNVAVGQGALTNPTGGNDNTAVGRAALSAADGNKNTGVGMEALSDADGDNNTAIGYRAGNGIITGSNNTILGYNADPSGIAAVGQIVIGANVTGTANNRITVGISSNIAELDLDGSDTSWAASSDERLKKNIADYTAGVAFISELRPVTYQWRAKRDVPAELSLYEDSDAPVHGKPDVTYHGFVAQEVKQALDNHPEVADGQHFWKLRDDGVQTVAPADLVPILVNAVKELTSRLEAAEAEIQTLKGA